MSPRSTDGTIQIVHDLFSIYPLTSRFTINTPEGKTIEYIEANENSDKDQRNVGLQIAKDLGSDWLLIIDADEIYTKQNFLLIRKLMESMEKNNQYVSYFQSLTFVDDLNHYTLQKFPRLFKIAEKCLFINDNYMTYNNMPLFSRNVIENMNIKYFHYAFCKGKRFEDKKRWWESRFGENYNNTGKKFIYDWYMDKNGKINSTTHKIYEFIGKHPEIMKTHKLYKK